MGLFSQKLKSKGWKPAKPKKETIAFSGIIKIAIKFNFKNKFVIRGTIKFVKVDNFCL